MNAQGKIETADENENFVALIQAAREDQAMNRTILAIVRLDNFNRESLLQTYISSLQLQGAPYELIEALNYLRDDAIAAKVEKILLD
ncbi:MAG: hypothetical protein EHM85_00480 [Desulfobacteraceae bacterium]|nr:MAG: hypothetical protein EHM85_00480 [Desulfobacteraceae bacterium]